MAATFRVGITRDILDSRGEPAFGRAALAILDDAPQIDWEYLPEIVREVTPDLAARYDALYVNMVRTPAVGRRARGLPAARRGPARRGLRLGRRARDDERRGPGDQHAVADATPRGDHRAHLHPRAGRQADAEGPPDAHRALGRAHGQHGDGPHRPHAGRRGRRPHRQGTAADGARVRSPAAGGRPLRERRRARLRRARARSTCPRCCANPTSS